MFICQQCLDKTKTPYPFPPTPSHGRCEECGETKVCRDVQAIYKAFDEIAQHDIPHDGGSSVKQDISHWPGMSHASQRPRIDINKLPIPSPQVEQAMRDYALEEGEVRQALAEVAAIRDFLDCRQISKAHDWENPPLANRVVQLAPEAAQSERQRIITLLQDQR